MIKINLAKRKTASLGSSSSGSGGADILSQIRSFLNRSGGGSARVDLKELPLFSILVSFAGVYGSQWFFEDLKQRAIQKETTRVAKQETLQQELRKKLSASAGLEEIKTNLMADLKLVNTKLETLQSLMKGRQAGVDILKGVSSAIPAEVWLSSVAMTAEDLSLTGQAVELNHVSDFMNRLEGGGFLTELNLENSSQTKDDRGGTVASFRLTAKRK